MPQLVINRSSDFLNKYKEVKILIDGTSVGIVADGETKVFDIQAGEHTIKAKMDWRGSKEQLFSVQKDGKVIYKLAGFKGRKVIVVLSAIALLSTFILPRESEAYIRTIIMLATLCSVVLFMLYILTVGRNSYLTLEQE